tara:strand:+ start:128 stop:580 length:453 start_codon:yes stop_codon:yes gene_type:complete
MKTRKGNVRRNTVKPNRDKRYEVLDINQGARSEMQGFDLLFVLGGSSLECDSNHTNCNHQDVTELYGKFGNKTRLLEVLSTTEERTAERLAEKELYRMILKFRDWAVLHSQGGHDCNFMRLHPMYLQIVEMYGGMPTSILEGLHKVYRNR